MEETKKTSVELESSSRRKAVKKIVGGVSALAAYNLFPVRWEKPIIEQVFLPAHAQTSGVATCDGCSLRDPCEIFIISGNQFSSEVVVRVDGTVEPPTAGVSATITVTPHGGGVAPPPQTTTTNALGAFTGTFTITGGPGIESVTAVTQVIGADGQAECSKSTHVEPEGEEPPAEEPPVEEPPAEEPPVEEPPECEPYTIEINNFMNASLVYSYTDCSDEVFPVNAVGPGNSAGWPAGPSNDTTVGIKPLSTMGFSTNGGNHDYEYRVNGGSWIHSPNDSSSYTFTQNSTIEFRDYVET